ncbi:hypothetical protein EB118_12410 [bacterium]|nr:hypothetical protein [bacterium]NDD83174.1 hypothetical protein [bacterium]NDG30861.1 hypothetical protein [bacterium]
MDTLQNEPTREFSRTSEDQCYIQRKDIDNNKKYKFITTSFNDLEKASTDLNFFGLHIKDQLFVPSDKMDSDSKLRYGVDGGVMTNLKVRHSFGQLPLPTMPSKYQTAHGATDKHHFYETQLNDKSCMPMDTHFHNRSFTIFDDAKGIETPNATYSVEKDLRCGISTRFTNVTQG